MPKSKESTARITMFHELKIPFVFTLEASFAGANKGKLCGQHFSIGDLENVGKCVLKALYQTKSLENNRKLLKEISVEIEKLPTQTEEDGDDSDRSSDDDDKYEETFHSENKDQQSVETTNTTKKERNMNLTNTSTMFVGKQKKKKFQK